jgi:hypothetical protein
MVGSWVASTLCMLVIWQSAIKKFFIRVQSGAINLYTVRHDQGTCFHALRGHVGPVSAIKILPGQTTLLSGSWDKRLMVRQLMKNNFLKSRFSPTYVDLGFKYRTSGSDATGTFISTDLCWYIWRGERFPCRIIKL